MKLHPPFELSPRGLPAIRLGDAWLSLDEIVPTYEDRDLAHFIFDFDDGTVYHDSHMKSAIGGFDNPVLAFDAFFGFLEAAIEAMRWEIATGRQSENRDLFPLEVCEWAHEHSDQIEEARAALCCDEVGMPKADLIEGYDE
jgi:hypothetical protein